MYLLPYLLTKECCQFRRLLSSGGQFWSTQDSVKCHLSSDMPADLAKSMYVAATGSGHNYLVDSYNSLSAMCSVIQQVWWLHSIFVCYSQSLAYRLAKDTTAAIKKQWMRMIHYMLFEVSTIVLIQKHQVEIVTNWKFLVDVTHCRRQVITAEEQSYWYRFTWQQQVKSRSSTTEGWLVTLVCYYKWEHSGSNTIRPKMVPLPPFAGAAKRHPTSWNTHASAVKMESVHHWRRLSGFKFNSMLTTLTWPANRSGFGGMQQTDRQTSLSTLNVICIFRYGSHNNDGRWSKFAVARAAKCDFA